MQSLAAGKGEPLATNKTSWGCLAGEQISLKGPGGLGTQQAGHGPAVWPGSKEHQQHPGLYEPQKSEQIEGSDHPPLLDS